jgi:hypothetical protein
MASRTPSLCYTNCIENKRRTATGKRTFNQAHARLSARPQRGERFEGGIGMSEFSAMVALIAFVITVVPLLLSAVIHIVVTLD